VAEVAQTHDVSEEAACLYLQLLALPNPSDKKLREFNGWTPKTLKDAGKALVAAKLVMQAKRARAGRELFLPCGWEDLKRPNGPIETWKLPLFGVRRTHEGKLDIPLGLILPVRPMHVLFAQAWGRTLKGDAPRYEEAKRRRR
ncbi:MAG: hypothetical protein JRH20_16960, partial [Deltaproteobacteria bacterium]|nr:hypothetical protein [Deltaproteobacteria bacterium]